MTNFASLARLAMMQENALSQLMTLGVEYEAKTITPERFAARVAEILLAHQNALRTMDKETT